MTAKKNPHDGSTFRSWLEEEGIYEEVTAAAQKKVLAWQIEQLMAKRKITKSELAKRMKTSRAAVDRLARHRPSRGERNARDGDARERRLAAPDW